MKSFANVNARDMKDAATRLKEPNAVAVGGGSDLLGMVKEHLVQPDVLVNLKSIRGLDQVSAKGAEVNIGGLITLDNLSQHPLIRSNYTVLAEAAESVATPQIRNAGTLAGNVCQRPWCWYYRNNFPCFKNGGTKCFSVAGENQFHAIFGGGPSFIVHPSDTAPALVALDAKFRIVGPSGERTLAAADFFALPKVNAAKENVLAHDEVLASVILPRAAKGTRSTYHKVLDREAWTHAVVSAAVAPIPWRLQKVEAMLAGQRITPELAAKAGEAAVEGAAPLAKNGYKVPLTKAVVRRTVAGLWQA